MKESKKYYIRRNYLTNKNKKDLNQENYKSNNNYQNSLITEILKNNKGLKMMSDTEKNNNVDNIKSNIHNIFSNDESRLKAIKYIIKSRQEKRGSSPNYSSSNKELFPQENIKRESTPTKVLYRTSYDLDNNNIQIFKKGNYNKRHILQISSDNFLTDEELSNHSHNNSKDNYRERPRKYNKRIIVKDENDDINHLSKNKNNNTNNESDNNIKSYKFPTQNNTNRNYKFTINLGNISNNNNKSEEANKMKEDGNKEKKDKIISGINYKKEEEKNCLNISFSEDGPFMLKNENNEKREDTNDKNNNLKDNNDEENNKILAINSHEISFRSFKNDNDIYNSYNNSNNNSFDIQDITKNSMKDIRGETSTKNNKIFVQCPETNFNLLCNKKDNNNLIFNSQEELINYIKKNNIKIENSDETKNELNKLKEENNNNKDEIEKLKKEKEEYLSEIKKANDENELLKKKINEMHSAYQELYKANEKLKEENEKNKNSNKIKNNYNIESNININIINIQKNQEKTNINKNSDEANESKNNKNNEMENNEKNDGLLTKAVFKFMNFFEKKKKQEESK